MELKIPPVALVVIAAALMIVLDRLLPDVIAIPHANAIAFATALAGLIVCASGVLSFRRARTTVNPLQPERATQLVTGCIYRYTRNPMYLGFALLLAALAVGLSSAPALLVLPVFVAYMNRFQITPEERALVRLFGETYASYRARVRRWL